MIGRHVSRMRSIRLIRVFAASGLFWAVSDRRLWLRIRPVRSPGNAFGKRVPIGLALWLGGTILALGQEGFLSPSRGEALLPGSVIDAHWAIRDATVPSDANEAELVLSLDGGRSFPIRVSAELSIWASQSRWQVPALPTARARLALRTGSGGRDEAEALRMLSEEFTILPDAEGRAEELHARRAEWWTTPVLSLESSDDRLSRHISSPHRFAAAKPGGPEMDDASESGLIVPVRWLGIAPIPQTSRRPPTGRSLSSRSRIPIALRL